MVAPVFSPAAEDPVEPPTGDAAAPVSSGGAAPLHLEALIAEAEASSPEVLASRLRALAASLAPLHVSALPDPLVSVSYTNESLDRLTLGDSSDSRVALTWQQEVTPRARRRAASAVAGAEASAAEADVNLLRARIRAEIKKAYATLHMLDRAVTILGESRALLQSYLQAARARYETGQGIQENILRAQMELTGLEAELASVATDRSATAAELNALIGRSVETPVGPAEDPLEPIGPLDRGDLERAALESSPQLAARSAETVVQQRRVEQARAELRPEWLWEASYMNRGGLDPMVMGLVGIRLPLWKERKQKQAIEHERLELAAAGQDVAAARSAVLGQIRSLVTRADGAALRRRLSAEGILPQARSALESAAASYASGKAEFVTLIEDFRALLGAERDLESRKEEEAVLLAELERLTGTTLVEPVPARAPAPSEGAAPPRVETGRSAS